MALTVIQVVVRGVELLDAFMPLSAGSRVGSYEILAPIGAGGRGEVYRALDSGLGRRCSAEGPAGLLLP